MRATDAQLHVSSAVASMQLSTCKPYQGKMHACKKHWRMFCRVIIEVARYLHRASLGNSFMLISHASVHLRITMATADEADWSVSLTFPWCNACCFLLRPQPVIVDVPWMKSAFHLSKLSLDTLYPFSDTYRFGCQIISLPGTLAAEAWSCCCPCLVKMQPDLTQPAAINHN